MYSAMGNFTFLVALALVGLSAILTSAKHTGSYSYTTSTTTPKAHNLAALNHTKTSLSFITSTITSKIQSLTSSTEDDPRRVSTSTVIQPGVTVTVTPSFKSSVHESTRDKLQQRNLNSQVSPTTPAQSSTVSHPNLIPPAVRRDSRPLENITHPTSYCHIKRPFSLHTPIMQYNIKLTTTQRPPDLCGGLWDNLKARGHCAVPLPPKDCGGEEGEPGPLNVNGTWYTTRWEFIVGAFCHPGYVEDAIWDASKMTEDLKCGEYTFKD